MSAIAFPGHVSFLECQIGRVLRSVLILRHTQYRLRLHRQGSAKDAFAMNLLPAVGAEASAQIGFLLTSIGLSQCIILCHTSCMSPLVPLWRDVCATTGGEANKPMLAHNEPKTSEHKDIWKFAPVYSGELLALKKIVKVQRRRLSARRVQTSFDVVDVPDRRQQPHQLDAGGATAVNPCSKEWATPRVPPRASPTPPPRHIRSTEQATP